MSVTIPTKIETEPAKKMCEAVRGRFRSIKKNDNASTATMITQPSPSLEHPHATFSHLEFLATATAASARPSTGHKSATITAPTSSHNKILPRGTAVGFSKKDISANVGF